MEREDYPPLSQIAGGVSQDGQRWYMRLIVIELGVALLAAVLVDIGSAFPGDTRVTFAAVAIGFLLVALAIQVIRLLRLVRFDEKWFEGRAVAESIKTATWRYMMQVPPFDRPDRADAEFSGRLEKVRQESRIIRRGMAGRAPEITDRMRRARDPGWEDRRRFYVEARLNDQIAWYRTKARFNAAWSRRLTGLSLALQLAAIGAAGLMIKDPTGSLDLVGIFTTAAASILAWSQAKRHDELKASYALAHEELCGVKDRVVNTKTEDAFIEGVVDGESAISREHTMWVAKSGSTALWTIRTDA